MTTLLSHSGLIVNVKCRYLKEHREAAHSADDYEEDRGRGAASSGEKAPVLHGLGGGDEVADHEGQHRHEAGRGHGGRQPAQDVGEVGEAEAQQPPPRVASVS